MQFLVTTGCIVGYAFMMGLIFRILADKTERPDDPWYGPGPFLGGLFWPIVIPFVLAGLIPSGTFSKEHRAEKRRKQELLEAEHQTALALERRKADEELDRQLAAVKRQRSRL